MLNDRSFKHDLVALLLLITCIFVTATFELSIGVKLLVVAGFGFGIYSMLLLSVRATLSELFAGDPYRQSVLELLASLKYLLIILVVFIGYIVINRLILSGG